VTIPRSLRTLLRLALGVAIVHVAFGGMVRISGAGLGCGPSWPQCQGAWFPPLDRPALVIEWTHRLLALILTVTVAGTAFVAWRARREPGVAGQLRIRDDADADQHQIGRDTPAVGRLDPGNPAAGAEDSGYSNAERDLGSPADMRFGKEP